MVVKFFEKDGLGGGGGTMATLLLLLSSNSLLQPVLAQNAKPNNNNTRFVPANVEENTVYCDIPPYQQSPVELRDDMCSNVDMDDDNLLQDTDAIQKLGEAYAPYLYFHPLENFTMSSVNRTFHDPTQGRILLNGLLFDDELDQQTLLDTTRDRDWAMFSHKFNFEYNDLSDDYKHGDGFDEFGLSRAPLYFHAFDSGHGTLTFNYFAYFTWTGAAHMGLVTSHNGTNQYVRMAMPPWGIHEGGWQSLAVTVCKHSTPSQPLVLTFRQNGFGQQLDCTQGQCTFHDMHGQMSHHTVGFVALSSHDIFPSSATDMVTDEVWPLDFWVNLQAFLLIERLAYMDTNTGRTRYFAPNSRNVLRLTEQDDLPDGINVTEWDYWGAFGGTWGRPTFHSQSDYPYCLSNDTLTMIECPHHDDNPVFLAVMQMLGVNETDNLLILSMSLLTDFLKGRYSHDNTAPTGPARAWYYDALTGVGNAGIWKRFGFRAHDRDLTGEEYCTRLQEIPDTFRQPVDVEVLPLVKNIIGIIILCGAFTIASACYFMWWRTEKLRPILERDEYGRFQQPDLSSRHWVYTKAWLYTAAWLTAIGGVTLFIVGYTYLFNLLESSFPGIDFGSITAILLLLGLFVLVLDSLLLIAVWLKSDDLWLQINETYFDIIGDDDGKENFKRLSWLKYNHGAINCFFAVSFSFLLLSLILAVVMVIIGVFMVGFAFAFGYACREVVGSLDGVCIRFKAFGMREVQCGSDLQEFCDGWAQQEMVLTTWGAFIVVVGHFFLICAGGMAMLHSRFAKRGMALLPTREEYARGLTHTFTKCVDPALVENNDDGNDDKNDIDPPQEEAPLNTMSSKETTEGDDDAAVAAEVETREEDEPTTTKEANEAAAQDTTTTATKEGTDLQNGNEEFHDAAGDTKGNTPETPQQTRGGFMDVLSGVFHA